MWGVELLGLLEEVHSLERNLLRRLLRGSVEALGLLEEGHSLERNLLRRLLRVRGGQKLGESLGDALLSRRQGRLGEHVLRRVGLHLGLLAFGSRRLVIDLIDS